MKTPRDLRPQPQARRNRVPAAVGDLVVGYWHIKLHQLFLP